MPTTETKQQSTTTLAEGRMRQNPQQGGKTTTVAAMVTTDSQADGKTDSQVGSKDLMSSSKKETIKQNQACQEEALRRIVNLQVTDAIASKHASEKL
jgi:hypothetical protein